VIETGVTPEAQRRRALNALVGADAGTELWLRYDGNGKESYGRSKARRRGAARSKKGVAGKLLSDLGFSDRHPGPDQIDGSLKWQLSLFI